MGVPIFKIGDIIIWNDDKYMRTYLQIIDIFHDHPVGVKYLYDVLADGNNVKFPGFFYDASPFCSKCRKLNETELRTVKCLFESERSI